MRKSSFALEMPIKTGGNYPSVLKEFWGEDTVLDPMEMFKKVELAANTFGAEFVSVYFNIENEDEIPKCKEILTKIVEMAKSRLIIRGSGQKDIDGKLLCELIPILKNKAIVASAQDTNYETIVKSAIKGGHTLVLRTPIDINLTKELNILSTDIGLKPENILIDPGMACVGYGLDWGYSIIERIKLAKDAGDKMLDMPIIVFSGEESFKAKEAKSTDFTPSWGDLKTRSLSWEIATTMPLICAGADIAVVWHPKTIETLRSVLC